MAKKSARTYRQKASPERKDPLLEFVRDQGIFDMKRVEKNWGTAKGKDFETVVRATYDCLTPKEKYLYRTGTDWDKLGWHLVAALRSMARSFEKLAEKSKHRSGKPRK